MQNLETNLAKAQDTLDSLMSVSWWTLSEDEQEAYADNFKKASDAIEELQRRISATREVRLMAKAMQSNTLF